MLDGSATDGHQMMISHDTVYMAATKRPHPIIWLPINSTPQSLPFQYIILTGRHVKCNFAIFNQITHP